nr:enoyl-CoA hydratase-related protein [Rhodothermus marinus]
MTEQTQPAIRYERDAEGIVTLTMDMPGRSANVINEALAEALAAALDRLEQEKDAISGVILTSAKPTFLAGADLEGCWRCTIRPRRSVVPSSSRRCSGVWKRWDGPWWLPSTGRRSAAAWSWRWPATGALCATIRPSGWVFLK